PGSAGVDRFPDAAVDVAEIVLVGPAGDAADGVDAAAAKRAEHAPVEANRNVPRRARRGPQDRRIPLESERREGDAGLGDAMKEIAARGHVAQYRLSSTWRRASPGRCMTPAEFVHRSAVYASARGLTTGGLFGAVTVTLCELELVAPWLSVTWSVTV